jgi:hypothetical protein
VIAVIALSVAGAIAGFMAARGLPVWAGLAAAMAAAAILSVVIAPSVVARPVNAIGLVAGALVATGAAAALKLLRPVGGHG